MSLPIRTASSCPIICNSGSVGILTSAVEEIEERSIARKSADEVYKTVGGRFGAFGCSFQGQAFQLLGLEFCLQTATSTRTGTGGLSGLSKTRVPPRCTIATSDTGAVGRIPVE